MTEFDDWSTHLMTVNSCSKKMEDDLLNGRYDDVAQYASEASVALMKAVAWVERKKKTDAALLISRNNAEQK